jgi:hypothetical protein
MVTGIQSWDIPLGRFLKSCDNPAKIAGREFFSKLSFIPISLFTSDYSTERSGPKEFLR